MPFVRCLWLLLAGLSAAAPAGSLQEPAFTAMWWAEGPPHYLTMKGPAPAPLLCLRSGSIGLMVDTRALRLPHAGRFANAQAKDAAMEAGTAPLLKLPAMDMQLQIAMTGRVFTCTGCGPDSKDEFFQPVRFVESGRFFQRVVIDGLQFADADGTKLDGSGSLEIALWPDRLSLALEMKKVTASETAELAIMADGKRATAKTNRVVLSLLDNGPDIASAQIEGGDAMKISNDPGLGCHVVRLPENAWSNAKGTYYPEEHLDRLDRWPITLVNPSDREITVRLMFVQEKHLPITGFTPMLCDPDGTPTGLPVQLSKNWHQRPEKGRLAHEGPWFHGFSFLRLPPKARRSLMFQMVYARYGGVPAASHAQLSLVGWGHNQFWDQAAIGSFGESICYEPGRVQRRCFIDDVRPLMTLPAGGGKPWGWADNCGGGDFLVWVDERGAYRGFRATRTDYRAHGPCLTDVNYVEEATGGEITARMSVGLARSDDYVRAFHRIRYEVRQPVKFQRLAFFQLGADYYNDTPARRVAVGTLEGLREEWESARSQGTYDRRSLPLSGEQPWLSIHGLDRPALKKGSAAASRGLILRAWHARLGGREDVPPHYSTYANEWGKGNFKTVIELSPPPGLQALEPGDFVEAEVEIAVFPADLSAYYGPNEAFKTALTAGADTWRLVHREAAGNAIRVKTARGSTQRQFPLVLNVDEIEKVEAVVDGGLGWLPVTFTGLRRHRDYTLRVNNRVFSQAAHGNDYWQTDFDPATGGWSQTFNLPRNDTAPLRLDFGPAPADHSKP